MNSKNKKNNSFPAGVGIARVQVTKPRMKREMNILVGYQSDYDKKSYKRRAFYRRARVEGCIGQVLRPDKVHIYVKK